MKYKKPLIYIIENNELTCQSGSIANGSEGLCNNGNIPESSGCNDGTTNHEGRYCTPGIWASPATTNAAFCYGGSNVFANNDETVYCSTGGNPMNAIPTCNTGGNPT